MLIRPAGRYCRECLDVSFVYLLLAFFLHIHLRRLFSAPVSSTSSPISRKRRTLPASEVAQAVVKSSPVPISVAEANESLTMLTKMCPFFLKKLEIAREEWLEMPASGKGMESESGENGGKLAPPSPGPTRGKHDSAEEVLNRSPKRVKKEEGGGLRAVREIIRRELEMID
jgi:DNA replication factor Cdt1 C-terminal domain